MDNFDPTQPPQFEPGDRRQNKEAFGAEAIAALKPKLEALKARFGSTTEGLAAAAIKYVLAMSHVACAIPGIRNERQVRYSLAPEERASTGEDIAFVRRVLAGWQRGRHVSKLPTCARASNRESSHIR